MRDRVIAAGFDAAAMVAHNPDLADVADPLDHFLTYGIHERRRFPIDLRPDALTPDLPTPVLAALSHAFVHSLDDRLVIDLERHWPRVERLMMLGARPVVIVGDSHSEHYRRSPVLDGGGWVFPVNLRLIGPSARGLGNPASRGGYGRIVRDFLARIARLPGGTYVPILFKFGQVDTEFVFTYKCLAAGLRDLPRATFDAFAREVVVSYVDYLAATVPAGGRAAVAAIFPPSLSDRSWRDGYVNGHIADLHSDAGEAELRARLRGLGVPDLAERTERHAAFNRLLREVLAERLPDTSFVDDFTPFLGPDGVIAPAFVARSQGRDHHMDFEYTAAPIEAVLRALAAGPR